MINSINPDIDIGGWAYVYALADVVSFLPPPSATWAPHPLPTTSGHVG